MFTEQDLKQIKNLILSFNKEKKYFPFADELIKKYSIFFPNNIDNETKSKIDDFINSIILEEVEHKKTKWWQILFKILKNNNNLWKNFRKLNYHLFYDDDKFQELWKQMEKLVFDGESRLTEKLVWNRSMWIQKASDAWYNLIYSIFPNWNKIK